MSDIVAKRIDELPAATGVGDSDLFVVEQSGVAKSIEGSALRSNFSQEVDDALSATSENAVQNKVIKAALDGKVDAVDGKVLSDNNYTDTEKLKLAGIATGANKTTVDSSLSASSSNPVRNSVIKAALDGKANSSSVHSLPAGGTAGQFLVKSSATDYDAAWVTVPNANGVSF